MKLIEIIDQLKLKQTAQELTSRMMPGVEYYDVILFMEERVAPDAELRFVDRNTIPGTIFVELDGKQYENLFQVLEAQELIQDFVNLYGKDYDNKSLVDSLLDYWLNDA